jgi:hypothetical protein
LALLLPFGVIKILSGFQSDPTRSGGSWERPPSTCFRASSTTYTCSQALVRVSEALVDFLNVLHVLHSLPDCQHVFQRRAPISTHIYTFSTHSHHFRLFATVFQRFACFYFLSTTIESHYLFRHVTGSLHAFTRVFDPFIGIFEVFSSHYTSFLDIFHVFERVFDHCQLLPNTTTHLNVSPITGNHFRVFISIFNPFRLFSTIFDHFFLLPTISLTLDSP